MQYYIPYDEKITVTQASITAWLDGNAKAFGFTDALGVVKFPLAFNSPRMSVHGSMSRCLREAVLERKVRTLCNASCKQKTCAERVLECDICRSGKGNNRAFLCRYYQGDCGGGGFVVFARDGPGLSSVERGSAEPEMAALVERYWEMVVETERRLAHERGVVALSERELEVLSWCADGKTGGEIAEILGVSNPTVRFHLKNVLQKLAARNIASAVSRGIMLGVLRHYDS